MRREAAALNRADAVYSYLAGFKRLCATGHVHEAGLALTAALRIAAEGVVELEVIRAADPQAAQAHDLPKRPMRVICGIGIAQPNPDPSNSHAATPPEPAPSIA